MYELWRNNHQQAIKKMYVYLYKAVCFSTKITLCFNIHWCTREFFWKFCSLLSNNLINLFIWAQCFILCWVALFQGLVFNICHLCFSHFIKWHEAISLLLSFNIKSLHPSIKKEFHKHSTYMCSSLD